MEGILKQRKMAKDRTDGTGRRIAAAGMRSTPKGLYAAMSEYDGATRTPNGTSIFDPVLCELVYRWLCPPGGLVLDPFAGGSVRGIVAAALGRRYVGVELRPEQVEANRKQWAEMNLDVAVDPITWHQGDSRQLPTIVGPIEADLIFSCPPYADLERYSDDPADLSTFAYPEFRAALGDIVAHCAALLKPDRFAVFVVGDARDRAGFYYGLPWHTVEAFEKAGLRLYNEAVLLTPIGSLPVRAKRMFETQRKLGKAHQNVLIFCKGDPKRATQAIGDVEFGDTDPLGGEDLAASDPDFDPFGRDPWEAQESGDAEG